MARALAGHQKVRAALPDLMAAASAADPSRRGAKGGKGKKGEKGGKGEVGAGRVRRPRREWAHIGIYSMHLYM